MNRITLLKSALCLITFISPVFSDSDTGVREMNTHLALREARLASFAQDTPKTLDFRGMTSFLGEGDPKWDKRWDWIFRDQPNWTRYLDLWSSEGFNAVLWWGDHELISGKNFLLRLEEFPQARQLVTIMHSYQLLAHYYEAKVNAAVAALVYAHSRKPQDKHTAEKLADQALNTFLNAAESMGQNLDPIMIELYGAPVSELNGPKLPELLELEKQERTQLPQKFHWPQ